jgi:carboxyl-terminal processing protease
MYYMGKKINKNSIVNFKKHGRFFSSFAITVVVIIVFFAGIQFGNGNWQINYFSKNKQNKDLPNSLDYSSVNQVYQQLKQKYDGKLDLNKLMIGMKEGLVSAAGDPYTTYFDAKQAKEFNNQLNGTITGIGAQLGDQQGAIIVIAPIAGSPADKAGIRAQDIIIKINDTSTSGMTIDQAISLIRGNPGTTVKLAVLRGTQNIDFSIIRQTITIPSVVTKTLEGNIGYIQISQFGDDTSQLVDKAATDFKSQHVKSIILDLRDNPGGYLDAAESVSSEWLKQGQSVVIKKTNNIVTETYAARQNGQLMGIPTVVLINGGSASASEITAGALVDNNAAITLGTKSFGKGSVQEFSNFSNGELLKVTMAHWFTPLGKTINKTGLEPTKNVPITDAQISAGQDVQLQAAEDYLNAK